jgi:hypothetical protein
LSEGIERNVTGPGDFLGLESCHKHIARPYDVMVPPEITLGSDLNVTPTEGPKPKVNRRMNHDSRRGARLLDHGMGLGVCPDAMPRDRTRQACTPGATGSTSVSVCSLGGAPGFNYASDYRDVDGIIFPTKRRVYADEGDNELVKQPLLVKIDMAEITLAYS